MAQSPVFPGVSNIQWGKVSAANTAKDGTGTVVTVFEAGPNGSKIDRIIARPLGTNIQTVLRLFINNGSSNTVADNNSLEHEETMSATTLSEVAALAGKDIIVPEDDGTYKVVIPHLPPGYKINATLGTAISAGIQITVIGSDF